MCGCTDHTLEKVRRAIRERHLTSIRAVMDFCEWRSADGCQKCRPALNFYLLAAWPGEVEDDYQSRFINERAHANIQKDGSYSVVPRIWGGVTTPAELRAIAEVADKYRVPTVKITGGQRIDLLGVKKEDLPRMWGDLNRAGFVSGHAYGKSLRTVKTCVGSEWCRFGTQDSTGLGIKLEKMSWGSWTPHKFKMAVSGCPRSCAGWTTRRAVRRSTRDSWSRKNMRRSIRGRSARSRAPTVTSSCRSSKWDSASCRTAGVGLASRRMCMKASSAGKGVT